MINIIRNINLLQDSLLCYGIGMINIIILNIVYSVTPNFHNKLILDLVKIKYKFKIYLLDNQTICRTLIK